MRHLKYTLFAYLLMSVFFIPHIHAQEVVEDAIKPELSTEIPGLSFSNILENDGVLQINYLGEYVGGLYNYLLGVGTLVAIVLIMVAGMQYAFGATNSEQVQKAKGRIRNAIVGLSLLLSVYMILFVINPQTVLIKPLNLVSVEGITLNAATSGLEGGVNFISREICDNIVAQAQQNGTCNITQTVGSPTGTQPNCQNHHWFDRGANGDYEKIKNMDYAAGWDTEIRAPFDAQVKYVRWTGNACGNEIRLIGINDAQGAKISICHAKDFTDENGNYEENRIVKKGEIVGHLGGRCCQGEDPPDDWAASTRGWCNVSGTPCEDPTSRETCECQDINQAGNTSGPHVHMTWYASGGDLLACLDY